MGTGVGGRLTADHHRIDEHLATFAVSLRGDAPDRAAFGEGAAALRHHIYVEEEFHFPPLREAGLLAPVLVMLREHGEIWDLLDAIDAALEARDMERTRASWPRLAEVLQQHNLKEERILYPAGDQALAPDVAARVADELAGVTPSGWVCAMAGRT